MHRTTIATNLVGRTCTARTVTGRQIAGEITAAFMRNRDPMLLVAARDSGDLHECKAHHATLGAARGEDAATLRDSSLLNTTCIDR